MQDRIVRLRRQQRRSALHHLGVNPDQDRVLTAQVSLTGREAELLDLPVAPQGSYIDAGNAFVVGVSAVGSVAVA